MSYFFLSLDKRAYAAAEGSGAAGGKLKYGYAKAMLQYRSVDHFRLSDSFTPAPYNPQQKGDRMWSDSEYKKTTLLAGLTPLPELDLRITFMYQDADKGLSPPPTRTREYSIWQWPVWKRQSVSFNGVFDNDTLKIESLFSFDKYDNRLLEYYNMRAFSLGIHHAPSAL